MPDYNQDAINQYNERFGHIGSGGGIQLPFPIVYWNWKNGNKMLKQIGGVDYFGGWEVGDDKLQDLAEATGASIPTVWTKGVGTSREGEEYGHYTTRSLFIAPIGARETWILTDKQTKQKTYKSHYVEGASRKLQLLTFAGFNSGEIQPWLPVILSVSGFQAKYLLTAINNWDRDSAAARKTFYQGLVANFFWLEVGTFGDTPETQMVGKTAQSPINPIHSLYPKVIDEAFLTSRFVGEATIAEMGVKLDEAQEWLNARRDSGASIDED